MSVYHPRCINGARCEIAVGNGGCFLSSLHPAPYCIRCMEKKYPERRKQRLEKYGKA